MEGTGIEKGNREMDMGAVGRMGRAGDMALADGKAHMEAAGTYRMEVAVDPGEVVAGETSAGPVVRGCMQTDGEG